jgi:hypothetical protein
MNAILTSAIAGAQASVPIKANQTMLRARRTMAPPAKFLVHGS